MAASVAGGRGRLPCARGRRRPGVRGGLPDRSPQDHTTDGKQWRDLGQLPALDVAADPDDAKRLLLADGRASLVELEVAGQPRPVESAPQLVLLDWVTPDLLAGVGPEGAVHRGPDGGESRQETGSLPEPPPAFTATEDRWYAATEAQILISNDKGKTWTEVGLQ